MCAQHWPSSTQPVLLSGAPQGSFGPARQCRHNRAQLEGSGHQGPCQQHLWMRPHYLGGGDILGRWEGFPWDGVCWGVLVMQTVVLEASCPVQLPRAGRLRAGELLVTLCPLLWLLPPGWHGVTDRLPGEAWCQMGTDLPWATHPSLMTITAWHCQAQ